MSRNNNHNEADANALVNNRPPADERNVFAIINTKSGERAAADFVLRQLQTILSERRRKQLRESNGVLKEEIERQQRGEATSPLTLLTPALDEKGTVASALSQREGKEKKKEEEEENPISVESKPTTASADANSPPPPANAAKRRRRGEGSILSATVVHRLAFEDRQNWRANAVQFLKSNIFMAERGQHNRQQNQREKGGEEEGGENNTSNHTHDRSIRSLSGYSAAEGSPRQQNVSGEDYTNNNSQDPSSSAKATTSSSQFSQKPIENVLIVAGGDGTVALAADLLNETGLLTSASSTYSSSSASASVTSPHRPPITTVITTYNRLPYFTIHIAVIPMGTGNDLSRSLGFGPGFVRGGCGSPLSFCGGDTDENDGCCQMTTLQPIVDDIICKSKVKSLDLWTMVVRPLLSAGAIDGGASGRGMRVTTNKNKVTASSPTSKPSSVAKGEEGGVGNAEPPLEIQNVRGNADNKNGGGDLSAQASLQPFASTSFVRCGNSAKNTTTVSSSSAVSKPNTTTAAESGTTSTAIDASLLPQRFNFVNYFSVGFDARICTDFHHFRQDHPKLCSTRLLNKAWYGLLGLKALIGEPVIKSKYVTLVVDGRRVPIPQDVKSIVISNVVSFAGGVKLWKKPSSRKNREGLYLDAAGNKVRSGPIVQSSEWAAAEGEGEFDGVCGGNREEEKAPNNANSKNDRPAGTYQEASLGDGLLEVQGLYGSLHMSMLQIKARHSTKIAQGKRIEMTIMYPQLLEAHKEALKNHHHQQQKMNKNVKSLDSSNKNQNDVVADDALSAAVGGTEEGRRDDEENELPPPREPFTALDNNNNPPITSDLMTPIRTQKGGADGRVGGESVVLFDGVVDQNKNNHSTVSEEGSTEATTPQLSTAAPRSMQKKAQKRPLLLSSSNNATAGGKKKGLSDNVANVSSPSSPISSPLLSVLSAPSAIAKLPKPLATQLDGEAMPAIESMLKEYGAVTLLITHRQEASMLSLAEDDENEAEED